MNKRVLLILGAAVLAFGIGITIFYLKFSPSRHITLRECLNAGGVMWRVDLDHPEICPACAEYRACETAYNAFQALCPECYGPCQEGQEQYSCSACKEENQRYSDIRDFCPQGEACTECMESNFPYPDRCPDGREKIGVISDTALWSQCCK